MQIRLTHLLIFCFLGCLSSTFAQLPNTDIWLLDINDDHGKITFSNPVNITNREGYDNQPAFSPDRKYILYSSVHEDGQADIYKYDISSKQTTQFTKTPESEYSPTFMPDGKNISVVRVEKDSSQRLWKFPLNGGEPALVMSSIKNVGYHCWINKDSVALFILPGPFTLQLADVNTEKAVIITDSIGRCTQLIPKGKALSYTTKDTSGHATIHQFCFDKREGKTVFDISMKSFKMFNKSEDYIWYNEHTLISGNGSELQKACVDCYDSSWKKVQDFKNYGINNIGRIAISPDRKKITLVTTK